MNLFSTNELEPDAMGWIEVVHGRKVKNIIFADFGFADTCVAFLTFYDDTYEVGQGEALRPYIQHYAGDNHEEASAEFIAAVAYRQRLENEMEDE
jgi:hypothetical protein